MGVLSIAVRESLLCHVSEPEFSLVAAENSTTKFGRFHQPNLRTILNSEKPYY